LKIEIHDARHGDVETNFATRSAGFQWFFSFFAAFSQYQESPDPIIVLLDEPGTSLHGEAQQDFVKFVSEELALSKPTMYTTHSQFMVDPARYEKLRAVHDRATRETPDNGVEVTLVSLSADRDTILPVESALGYSRSRAVVTSSICNE
jgi:predicted ATP-dependent endonuclease of OLD family